MSDAVHGGPRDGDDGGEPRAPGEPDPAPGRVVGIDPGLGVTGYAVVEPTGRGRTWSRRG